MNFGSVNHVLFGSYKARITTAIVAFVIAFALGSSVYCTDFGFEYGHAMAIFAFAAFVGGFVILWRSPHAEK